jgi:aldehyde dehydrogenase (NAD+)
VTRKIVSIDPRTEKVLGSVTAATQSDYARIMNNAQSAFTNWRALPAPKRGEVVRQIGDALRANKSQLGTLISREMGKSKEEGDGEVQEMIDMADFAVGQSRMLYGLTMQSERPEHRLYEQWHPLGIVGVITAFNFPMAVWSWNAFIAAVAGNCVVWKPSPKVPLCALAVQKLCDKVMAKNNCKGVFSNFVTDDVSLINRFVDDRRVPLISFTGSTAVGNQIAQRVAARFGKTILECSGNNAVIVDETADLKLASSAVLFGAVGTCGQRCTTTRRVFVQDSIYDHFVRALVKAYKSVTTELTGPLVDAQALTTYEAAIIELKAKGARILVGGKRIHKPGYFVAPTLVEAESDWPMVKRETFAPILYVMRYKKLEEAIAAQNDVEQGLSSSLFTQNLKHAELFLSSRGSDCGIANINVGTSGAEIGGAFGGEKSTGGGRESGSDSWKAYMRRQTNTINWSNQLPLAQGIRFDVSRRK